MALLAHSPKGDVPEQTYKVHVQSVNQSAKNNIKGALQFFFGSGEEKSALQNAVDFGSLFHDLGKVDEKNQEVLKKKDCREKLPLNHCDAGTSWLLQNGALNSALLVYCHHVGLFSMFEEQKKHDGNWAFRDIDIAELVDEHLSSYLTEHSKEIAPCDLSKDSFPLKGLSLRLALSCIADADHHDTASHYGNEPEKIEIPPRWEQRLEALTHYVGGLQETGVDNLRNQLRKDIYKTCLRAAIEPPVKCCDAPVGSGKTTAVMAHLLAIAKEQNLRHIFVVLPYTNIIQQSVEVYRKAIVLPGENPEEIVAAHYHQADFSDLGSRHLATLWRTPIVVTSAVQFFETLSGCETSRLRKLHELPGSAVFIDESHAAMPMQIWPQQWKWIKELSEKWGSYFVLASGSLVKFWEFPIFLPLQNILNILPDDLRVNLIQFEGQRVTYPVRTSPMNRFEIIELVISKPGPRLVILNTVQSAAVIAYEIKKKRHNVLHLSTALAPVDRKKIIDLINWLLGYSTISDWTLVATSCVEAGVDFSFKTAFRESCSMTSLIQTGGRANRQGFDKECEIIDFRTRDPILNHHPAFETSRTVLDQIFDEGLINKLSPMELATDSVRRELGKTNVRRKAEQIIKMESEMNYKEVSKLTRIIDADTRIVVVSPRIISLLKNREKVTAKEILQHSVQLWSNKIRELGLKAFEHYGDLYFWEDYPYDPKFLGYMEGLMSMIYLKEEGFVI